MFKKLRKYWRLWRACAWWKRHSSDIEWFIATDDNVSEASFKWHQLAWQEIDMYIRLGTSVDLEEFTSLCHRRYFNREQRIYLVNVLRYVGIGQHLSVGAVERGVHQREVLASRS
ncbi:MAG TPA: hypothetical protein VGL77_08455 [Armatimonadota bacterium]|jgi:hypothetical protein